MTNGRERQEGRKEVAKRRQQKTGTKTEIGQDSGYDWIPKCAQQVR